MEHKINAIIILQTARNLQKAIPNFRQAILVVI